MLEFFPPGTPVTLKGGSVDAGILRVDLTLDRVRYKVFWWVRRKGWKTKKGTPAWKRKTAWVESIEVEPFEGFSKVKVAHA